MAASSSDRSPTTTQGSSGPPLSSGPWREPRTAAASTRCCRTAASSEGSPTTTQGSSGPPLSTESSWSRATSLRVAPAPAQRPAPSASRDRNRPRPRPTAQEAPKPPRTPPARSAAVHDGGCIGTRLPPFRAGDDTTTSAALGVRHDPADHRIGRDPNPRHTTSFARDRRTKRRTPTARAHSGLIGPRCAHRRPCRVTGLALLTPVNLLEYRRNDLSRTPDAETTAWFVLVSLPIVRAAIGLAVRHRCPATADVAPR
jgi:hypothetical protein